MKLLTLMKCTKLNQNLATTLQFCLTILFVNIMLHPRCTNLPFLGITVGLQKEFVEKEVLNYNTDIVCMQEVETKRSRSSGFQL